MGSLLLPWIVGMTQDEKKYFKELGRRVALLRKEQNLTQVALAEQLGISQQMVASYEVGRRRVPVSMLPALAHALAVPIDALLGHKSAAKGRRGPPPKLQHHFERIGQLPKAKQRFVLEMLDTVLSKAS